METTTSTLLYFKKIFVSQPLLIGNEPVKFTPLGSNIGVISVPSDSALGMGLSQLAAANGGRGRGGVIAIDEPTFEDLKKKLPYQPSLPRLQPKLQVFNPLRKPKPSPVAAAVVAAVEPAPKISVTAGGPDGVGGAGGAPAAPSAPKHPEGITTAKKSFKFPVIKKTTSRSLSGGVLEPEPKD